MLVKAGMVSSSQMSNQFYSVSFQLSCLVEVVVYMRISVYLLQALIANNNMYTLSLPSYSGRACLYAPHVEKCGREAFFHKQDLERVVNVGGRGHLVRYYNNIGTCLFFDLIFCC